MATWKKLVVSGSDISQLNNDSAYLVSGDSGIQLSGSFSGSFEGDGSGLTGVSAQVEESLTLGAGIFGGTFDGSAAVTAAIDSGSLAGNGLETNAGKFRVKANGTTIDVASGGIQVVEANLRGIPNVSLTNSASIIGTTQVDLGATVTTLAGVTLTGAEVTGSFSGDGSDLTGVVATLGNSLTDGNGIADFTFDGSGAASVAVDLDGSTLAVGANGVKVADAGITATQIAAAVAGAGLAGGAGTALSVNVDDSTIEIDTDTLRVKQGGIGTTQLADDSVTNAKIGAGAVGTTEIGDEQVTTDKIADSLGTIGVNSFTGSFSGSFSGDVDINLEDLTAGNGLSGTAYDGNTARTFAVAADSTTGGDTVPVSVGANGVGLNVQSIIGNGISADGSGNIDVSYGSTANTAVQGSQTAQFTGTANEVTVSDATAQAMGGGVAVQIGLPDDVTISQDLTVTRNLIVQGTASFQHETNLDVADRFIRLASGSSANGDGGIVVQQSADGTGEVFGFDNPTKRFGVLGDFDASAGSFSPDAFMAAVVEGGAGVDTPTAVSAKYIKKGNLFVGANQDIYIYS